MNQTLLVFVAWLLVSSSVMAESTGVVMGHFSQTGLDGWEAKSFAGETRYRLIEMDGQTVVEATSDASASGLVYTTEFDPNEFPVISWRWKVDGILSKGDGRTKAGDDYPARVYIVFPHWFFPKTRSLNYIWANRLPKDSIQPNAFTSNAMMIAVESGPNRVGQWVTVERNIVEDFRRAFGEDPPRVGAIAIMTDTDNTQESVRAWYGDIEVRRRSPQ